MYTLGKDNPLNFTLRTVEYSVVRQTLRNTYIPKANEKLVILRFSVQNPQKREFNFTYSDIKMTLIDSKDRNYFVDSYAARDGETQELSVNLKPAQKVDVYMVQAVPADVSIPKMIVQSGRDSSASVLRYDLRQQIVGLKAPFGDTSGFRALERIVAKLNATYPMGYFDGALESFKFSTESMNKRPPAEGKQYLIATFKINNAVKSEHNFDYGSFKFDLTDEDGSSQTFDGYLIRMNRDERAEGKLAPGGETRFRIYLEVSKGAKLKTLSMAEGESRAYLFDVSSAK